MCTDLRFFYVIQLFFLSLLAMYCYREPFPKILSCSTSPLMLNAMVAAPINGPLLFAVGGSTGADCLTGDSLITDPYPIVATFES